MTANLCPTGCGRIRRHGHLMCAPCWHEVPAHLQRDVMTTWKAWRKAPGSTTAFRAYSEAHDNAIGAIQ